MQIITYVNLLGETVIFGGGPPYVLESVRGLGAVSIDQTKTSGVYQQGATIQRLRRNERNIDIKFHIDGAPMEAPEWDPYDFRWWGEFKPEPQRPPLRRSAPLARLYEMREKLMRVLSPQHALNEDTGETARLYYRNDHGEWWLNAIPEGPNLEKRLQNFMVSCPLTFVCPSPFFQTMSVSELTLEMGGGGLRLPFRLPIRLGHMNYRGAAENGGHVNAPVIIEIAGSGESPKLVNHTTGAIIEVTRAVAFGEKLTIDTNPDDPSVTLTQTDGTEISAYGYLGPQSAATEFFLRPGVNDIEYLPSAPNTESRVTLKWRGFLEGV